MIAVVIPTRNRGDSVVGTIRSILRGDCADVDVIVVDQSDGDTTEIALAPFRHDGRVRYMKTATRGRAAALNAGIGNTQADQIAVTDDDCEVDRGWVPALLAAFAFDPRITVVFGNVLPCPHDRSVGFAPGYVRAESFLARGIGDRHRVAGTSACMALRRSAWEGLGGFDPMLGAGAPFRAGEDADFAMAAALRGEFIYETPAAVVTHHGFYRWKELPAVLWGYWYGTGAAFAKSFKRHRGPTALVLARLACGWALGAASVADTMGDRGSRWRRLAAFAKGFGAGMITPVNRTTGHFVRASRDTGRKLAPLYLACFRSGSSPDRDR